MIITLGILSVFQLVFLPGLIVTRLMKLQGVGINILFSISLSPIINYLYVFTATMFGLYSQKTTLLLFGVELVFLIYLTYPLLVKTLGQIINKKEVVSFFKEYLDETISKLSLDKEISKIFFVTIFILALYNILKYYSFFAAINGSIFTEWDAVVSWDRWAVDWSRNHFPSLTYHYPQLIPANWSITYQFMGDSRIKFFAKYFMGLIEIYILLVIFILGIIKRQAGYFFGVIYTSALQLVFGSHGNGYVDSSVAFFSLSSIACLLIAEKEDNKSKSLYIYLGAIFAAGAAVTKQAGLWVALAYPFLLFFTNYKKENRKYAYNYISGILMFYALIIFPWYGYKEFQIQNSNDRSEIVVVTSLGRQDRSWTQQLEYSSTLLQTTLASQIIFGKLIMMLLCVFMLFACRNKFYRFLLSFIVIPFSLIWALFVSYDTRNFNLVVPLIGLSAGIGTQEMIVKFGLLNLRAYSKIKLWFYRMKESIFLRLFPLGSNTPPLTVEERARGLSRGRYLSFIEILKSIKVMYLLLLILTLSVFLLPIKYADSFMINVSLAKQKEIGYPWLNQKLYKYQSEYGINGLILTDYHHIGMLPGLEQYYKQEFNGNLSAFLKERKDSHVGYVLLNTGWMSPKVAIYVRQNIAQGQMKIIFEEGSYLFASACRWPCAE